MPHARSSSTSGALMRLQRAAGNQAIQRSLTGSPLPRELRPSLERAFRRPLENVRVHTGTQSQIAADAIGARAFTVGHDIHLGSEGLRTSGKERRQLLTHEVVHTLQQGSGTHESLKVGEPDDAHERQAERLSSALPSLVRETIGHSPGGVAQRAMHRAHFGEFEDNAYAEVTNAAGDAIGVEMDLKFHPNENVQADLIGLTQSATGTFGGTLYTQGALGQRQATSGPGAGRFIDRVPGRPNPIYATAATPDAGGNAAELADYTPPAVQALTPAQQTQVASTLGVTGMHYNAGAQHGWRKFVNGAWETRPAELYDAPHTQNTAPNSEQVFETTALALAGSQKDTYYGSVEWGWRRDSAGILRALPFRVVSQGVPTAGFLTAANIWNASRVNFGYVANVATDLKDNAVATTLAPIAAGDQMTATGRGTRSAGNDYVEVTYNGITGWVISTAVRAGAGPETIDLPVPMVHTVASIFGTTILLRRALTLAPWVPGAMSLAVPFGTRIMVTRCMAPTMTLPDHYEGRIIDGPYLGIEGFFPRTALALETLGTR